MGTRVVRKEDPRFMTRGGIYTSDLRDVGMLEGAAHVVFVRSTVAHGTITSIDTSEAEGMPGVVGVFTAESLGLAPDASAWNPMVASTLLASDRVRYVGEPVAAVVAESVEQAMDAAEMVFVDYDVLDAVIDVDRRDVVGHVVVRRSPRQRRRRLGRVRHARRFGRRVLRRLRRGRVGVVREPAGGPVPVGATIVGGGVGRRPAPPVALVAERAPGEGTDRRRSTASRRPTSTSSWPTSEAGSAPRSRRSPTTGCSVSSPRQQVDRCVGPRRGASRWSHSATVAARLQNVTIGGTRDGRVTHYRLEVIQDCGATAEIAAILPPFMTRPMAAAVYDIPNIECRTRSVVTNTTPMVAYRGAGRPEATAAIERAMDLFAAEVGLDPAERPAAQPRRAVLRAAHHVDRPDLRRRQLRRRARPRPRGCRLRRAARPSSGSGAIPAIRRCSGSASACTSRSPAACRRSATTPASTSPTTVTPSCTPAAHRTARATRPPGR